jgi:hypothetical protein
MSTWTDRARLYIRGRAFLLDLGADPATDGDLQVGGGQLQTRLIGGQENVAEDGQGAARGDRTADDR